jgi:hypothetical protein
MSPEEAAGLVRVLRIRGDRDPVLGDAARLIEMLLAENARLFDAADRTATFGRVAAEDPEAELLAMVGEIASLAKRLDAIYPKLPPEMKQAVDRVTALEVIGPKLAADLRDELSRVEPIPPGDRSTGRPDQTRDAI